MAIHKLKIGIIGSGKIGTDLLIKVLRSPSLECTLFMGRRPDSPGLQKAREMNVLTSDKGIQSLVENPKACDLVFDATSAKDHHYHSAILRELGKIVIDMTPSGVGTMFVPAISLDDSHDRYNLNMVSCGGQASIPLAFVMAESHEAIDYIEVVSSIASKSAGPATRLNMDEYIETTEAGLRKYTRCKVAKSILILNPAEPCIDMQTTVSAKVNKPNLDGLVPLFEEMVKRIQRYVPGYEVIVPPVFEKNRIVTMVRVRGRGDYLPQYAGNLDIINCAAIATAEQFAAKFQEIPCQES